MQKKHSECFVSNHQNYICMCVRICRCVCTRVDTDLHVCVYRICFTVCIWVLYNLKTLASCCQTPTQSFKNCNRNSTPTGLLKCVLCQSVYPGKLDWLKTFKRSYSSGLKNICLLCLHDMIWHFHGLLGTNFLVIALLASSRCSDPSFWWLYVQASEQIL